MIYRLFNKKVTNYQCQNKKEGYQQDYESIKITGKHINILYY
jgi:hypothetical protein